MIISRGTVGASRGGMPTGLTLSQVASVASVTLLVHAASAAATPIMPNSVEVVRADAIGQPQRTARQGKIQRCHQASKASSFYRARADECGRVWMNASASNSKNVPSDLLDASSNRTNAPGFDSPMAIQTAVQMPEPATLTLFGSGFALIAWRQRRWQRTAGKDR